MSELTTIARPYARAAFDFALERDEIGVWQEKLIVLNEIVQNNMILNILNDSSNKNIVYDIILSIFGDELDIHFGNFIKIMLINNRLMVIPEVIKLYIYYVKSKEGRIDVEVISAIMLDEEQKNNISQKLEERLSKKVNLQCSVDKDLIAGAVIKVEDTVIDRSVSSKLHRLYTAIQS